MFVYFTYTKQTLKVVEAMAEVLRDRGCCRRYWKHNLKTVRRLGTERGGVFADGIHFRYQGGQVRSLLSLLSYLGSGEYRKRYLGIKIPLTNLQEHHLEEARKFAAGLANRLTGSASVKHDIA